jgi:hypothetical protein
MAGSMAAEGALEGGCLCGAVRYRIEGGLAGFGPVVLCHCGQCRKAQGSAFAANVPIDAASFTLLQGADALVEYASSADKLRSFCGRCGSPIHSRRSGLPGVLRLRLGSLDEAPAALRPTAHIHAASKAAWWDLPEDGLPRHPTTEPGRG